MQKNINKDYNIGEFLEKLLEKEKIKLVGNTASVDGYTFIIDRERLIIVEEIEEAPTKVQIAKVVTSYLGKKENDKYYVKAEVTIESEEEIESINLTLEDGTNIEITPNGKTATQELELEIGRKYKVITITKGGVTNQNTLIEEKEEKVNNVNELVELRNNVNKGLTYEGKILTQTQDIDLSSVCNSTIGSWNPIGYAGSSGHYFKGTYNGDKKEISNIYIDNSEDKTIGLFGFLGYGGTVKNVILHGEITQRASDRAVGGIVGRNEGIVDNCINYANVSHPTESVGGIVGYNINTIKNCQNHGDITGVVSVGGITAHDLNTSIASTNEKPTIAKSIDNCINNGIVTATSSIVGGIIGQSESNITNCKNTGTVISNGNPDDRGNTQGTGGIAGRTTSNIRCSSNEGTIKSNGFFAGGILGVGGENTNIAHCYNKGTIEIEKNCAGGIVGLNAQGIRNCYNYLTEDKKIKAYSNAGGIIGNEEIEGASIWNCYSIGKNISSNSNAAIIAAWWASNIEIANCFYLDTDSLSGVGINHEVNLKKNEIYEKSIESFKLPVENTNSVIYQLEYYQGDNSVWGIANGVNNDLPYLKQAK